MTLSLDPTVSIQLRSGQSEYFIPVYIVQFRDDKKVLKLKPKQFNKTSLELLQKNGNLSFSFYT